LLLLPPLVLLIIFILPEFLATQEAAEISKPVAQMRGAQSALELFYNHYKCYPENLEILIKEGYLQKNGNVDPWVNKNQYKPIYSKDSNHKADNYLLGSSGADGKFDTEDDIKPPINTIRHTFKNNIELKK